MYPDSKIGRAHFYAPVKMIGDWQVDTLWFNLAMIWSITALFYLALIKDALRRTLQYLSRFFRRNKY